VGGGGGGGGGGELVRVQRLPEGERVVETKNVFRF